MEKKLTVIENIKRIREEKNISQEALSYAISDNKTTFSKVEAQKRKLRVDELDKIANVLEVDVLYLFTYPKHYVEADSVPRNDRVSITFEVSPSQRDSLLKMVIEERDINIKK